MKLTVISRKNECYEVLFDEGDAYEILQRKWYVSNCRGHFYAKRFEDGKVLYMHRLIVGETPRGFDVDHINGNGLDNRRSNLRVVSHSENLANTGPSKKRATNASRFKGVWFERRTGKWCASLTVKGVRRNLGTFLSEENAARAYNKAVEVTLGSVGYLNGGLT